jgi:ABC-type antimicrobial peptide transport system permease subunit
VRIALGAGERSVLALVLREGLRMCIVGIVLGLVASSLVGRGWSDVRHARRLTTAARTTPAVAATETPETDGGRDS